MTSTHTLTLRVAHELRAELDRRGLTQQDLATMLGWSQQRVSRRVAGAVPLDVAELEAVAAVLGIPPRQLMGATAAGA